MLRRKLTSFSVLLVVLMLCACAAGDDDDDDDNGGTTTTSGRDACEAIGLEKVANGEACSFGANPSASSLVRISVADTAGSVSVCTGVALTQTAVLSAGHCFSRGVTSLQLQTFGGVNAEGLVIVHPGFDDREYEQGGLLINDAAVIIADRALEVSVSPLLVSRPPDVGETAVVAGFGETAPGSGPSTIHAGDAVVTGVTGQHVVIQYEGDQAHPCRGDSGSPLLLQQGGREAIAGTVSQSDPSVELTNVCRPGDMTLYASTQDPSISNFILSVVPDAQTI